MPMDIGFFDDTSLASSSLAACGEDCLHSSRKMFCATLVQPVPEFFAAMWKKDARLRALLKRFRDDKRGVISIFGAFAMVAGIGVSAMVVDVGHLYLTKRRLQTVVDAAALAAAGDPQNATAIAQDIFRRNGYPTDQLSVQPGHYTADPVLSASARLDTNPARPPNAVKVVNRIATNDFLASIFNSSGKANVSATATAAQTPTVSFSAGTGLAQIDAGLLNAVLGKLLGTTLSLSFANWHDGLAAANVDALTFLNQFATHAGLAAGTYGDLANANLTVGQFILAAQAALNAHPGDANNAALDALNLLSLQVPQQVSATVGSIIDTTLWKTRKIGSIVQQDQGQTTINLLDTITAMARLYGSNHLADVGTSLSIPVTNTSISAYVTAGQPQASAAVAALGTTITTSQVRLLLNVTAANVNLGLATAKVVLPIYVEIASGKAQVKAIPCQTNGTMVTISSTATGTTAQIGSVTQAQLQDFGQAIQPTPAAVVQLSVQLPLLPAIPVSIQAGGTAAVAAGAPTDMNFTLPQIQAGTAQTVAGSNGQLISGVAQNLTLTASGNGITSAVSNLVNTVVMPLLRPLLVSILSTLDPVVGNLLQTLGVKIGTLDVTVHGASCGRSKLIG